MSETPNNPNKQPDEPRPEVLPDQFAAFRDAYTGLTRFAARGGLEPEELTIKGPGKGQSWVRAKHAAAEGRALVPNSHGGMLHSQAEPGVGGFAHVYGEGLVHPEGAIAEMNLDNGKPLNRGDVSDFYTFFPEGNIRQDRTEGGTDGRYHESEPVTSFLDADGMRALAARIDGLAPGFTPTDTDGPASGAAV